MTDAIEIASMFTSSNRVDESSYTKEEFVEVYDLNGQNYATGQVLYNTDSQMKHHVVLSDSYTALPVSCAKSVDGRVAVKNSIVSLIQGLQVESGSGTSICNEQISTPILANLRLLIDSSLDFKDANELMYCGPDKTIDRNVSGADNSVVGSVLPSASSGEGLVADALNYLKNPALANRITVLTARSTFIGGPVFTQNFVAFIPLRFIHDFFRAMDFPMVNLSLRITLNVAGAGSYAAFNPWTAPVFPEHSTLGPLSAPAAPADFAATVAPAVPSPVISGTSIVGNYTDRFGGKFAPRLFLKTVYFTKDVAEALRAKMAAGFTKELTYTVSNYYPQSILAGAANAGVSWPFVQGVIRPTRIWVFPLAAGTLASASNTFPSRTGQLALRNTNLVLNGDNFYNKNFQTQYEYYREFKKQLIAAGSSQTAATPISYSDFISGSAYYCFDLSRNLTVQSNGLCTLALNTDLIDQTTNAAPAGAVDMCVILERLQVVTFKVSEGGVEVVVKQGTAA